MNYSCYMDDVFVLNYVRIGVVKPVCVLCPFLLIYNGLDCAVFYIPANTV